MGASVNKRQREATAKGLRDMQINLLMLAEQIKAAGDACRNSNAAGLAFSLFMLQESIKSYCRQVEKWTQKHLDT